MKLVVSSLTSFLLFALLAATRSFADNPPPHFEHIVIIVQENRTPDNLFGGAPAMAHCNFENPFEPGVDIVDGGPDATLPPPPNNIRCLVPLPLGPVCENPDHSHGGFKNMLNLDSNGIPQMNGACRGYSGSCGSGCPMYSYVNQADVMPYYSIATNYGFANYFFQTSQGPSFPAHQFLLSGTSGPDLVNSNDTWWKWFDAENMLGVNQSDAGCIAASGRQAKGIDPSTGTETASWYSPPSFMNHPGYPCYDHRTMIDLFEGVHPNITWKYYAALEKSIWTAPNAIHGLCGGIGPQQHCPNFTGSGKYASNIRLGSSDLAPIYADITACQLAQVSWVIPDKKWWDHPGNGDNIGKGPYYVANIVNLIGQSWCVDSNTGNRYWKDTAILIVWDDWGGWYGHVPPFRLGGYDDQDTNGQRYVYGFRVPFLVVSPYTPDHYVSGAITGTPSYPPPPHYTHDFGSILKFVENNWSLGEINPNTQPPWHYADFYAIDNNPTLGHYALGDFFQGSYRDFTSIPVDPQYGPDYFSHYPGVPEAPVDDTDD